MLPLLADVLSFVWVVIQYRDSVMEITAMLQQHYPTVKAMSFIGHNSASQSGKGLSQKKQLQVKQDFIVLYGIFVVVLFSLN